MKKNNVCNECAKKAKDIINYQAENNNINGYELDGYCPHNGIIFFMYFINGQLEYKTRDGVTSDEALMIMGKRQLFRLHKPNNTEEH